VEEQSRARPVTIGIRCKVAQRRVRTKKDRMSMERINCRQRGEGRGGRGSSGGRRSVLRRMGKPNKTVDRKGMAEGRDR